MIIKLMKMEILEEGDDLAYGGTPDEDMKQVDGRPAWMRTLHTSVATWLNLIPRVSENKENGQIVVVLINKLLKRFQTNFSFLYTA